MLPLSRRVRACAVVGTLAAVLAGPASAQSPPSEFGVQRQTPVGIPIAAPSTGPVLAPVAPLAQIQAPADPNMSSRPPAFTLPSPGAPAAKDAPKDESNKDAAKDDKGKDSGAPGATNDANPFAGFPQVQSALANLLPGNFKDTKYKWYGFVRVDGIYDTRPMGSTDSFVTSSIPIPQGRGQNVVLTPRYTRLGFDTLTPLKDCNDWEVKTRIEMDFFNGNTSGAFGSYPIRLRFAWIDVGPFLVGQAASLFMDYDVFPNVLDYQGPPGMVLMRQPVLAYRAKLADNLKLSVGVEHPYSDIQWEEGGAFVVNPGNGILTQADVPKNIQSLPDFTANLRYTGDYGHVQAAGVLRRLTYQSASEQVYNQYGYGVNLTGTFHPWACLHGVPNDAEGRGPWEKSRFLAQYAWGRGVARYFQDTNGLGLDAVFEPATGLRLTPVAGWFVAYEQWWTDKLASVFTYGRARVDLTAGQPADTYQAADYVTGNLIWFPVERLGMGAEVLYGTRENKDGATGHNVRFQTAVQYKF